MSYIDNLILNDIDSKSTMESVWFKSHSYFGIAYQCKYSKTLLELSHTFLNIGGGISSRDFFCNLENHVSFFMPESLKCIPTLNSQTAPIEENELRILYTWKWFQLLAKNVQKGRVIVLQAYFRFDLRRFELFITLAGVVNFAVYIA